MTTVSLVTGGNRGIGRGRRFEATAPPRQLASAPPSPLLQPRNQDH
jgi:hypothetical protein